MTPLSPPARAGVAPGGTNQGPEGFGAVPKMGSGFGVGSAEKSGKIGWGGISGVGKSGMETWEDLGEIDVGKILEWGNLGCSEMQMDENLGYGYRKIWEILM